MRYFPVILLLILLSARPTVLAAQQVEDVSSVNSDDEVPAMPIYINVGKIQYKGDSIAHIILPTFYKYPPLQLKSEAERQRYNRLVANVKRLLPLAKLAKILVIETYEYIETLPDKKARMAHLNQMEKDLHATYGPTLKKLSRSQGRLLVKLIDRECNQTGYDIAKAFIGSFKANAYQALAFCFGNSLTKHYDPEGDDYYIERVCRMVESGQL